MKNAELSIDYDKIPKESEQKTEVDICVNDFDVTQCEIRSEDEFNDKMISYVEKEIRSSYEYKKYIGYLKTELDLTKCALLPNLDCSDGAASLEFHHFPMNLYEITETVGKKMIDDLNDNQSVSCFQISEQVMKEHYLGNVGLVPLTKTLHDMAHNQSIIIPISKVNGNYKRFVNKYSKYIDKDIKDRITLAELNNDNDDARMYNKKKLEKNILNYNINYNAEGTDEEEI